MYDIVDWTARDAGALIAEPDEHDDKYSRGVLGIVTGSSRYPGAAVLGVSAALAAGVGMVRFRGASEAASLVLAHCPEAVTAPGRVQAWLAGSGIPVHGEADAEGSLAATLLESRAEDDTATVPVVVDAGALSRIDAVNGGPRNSLAGVPVGPIVMTPHHGELAALLGVNRASVAADPVSSAIRAAERASAVVLLKGSRSVVVTPAGAVIRCPTATPWLATAGTGDVLAGILGALVATHAADIAATGEWKLAELAAAAVIIHSRSGERASQGGPFTVRQLVSAISPTVAELLA
ncbi:ADP-dependent NAD(P)H-hydrate dehydratase [Salinibacterium hongtaonis]|uniref:ADP-dependent (S)-NAD(P)H-hydrate dehydratase n=1 Tax=Homoserinimonas hongtaonis TaxID=2079791 RepID=A0A2U1SX67_9MICO|nr:ADP/ATP-dependent (S)-NAD(P)H-hydrate dehydratase [Salinibacterium hongtaonis]AWB88781.1 NAD(P)H-hydrate dehydratase [Salinibacterium hongtaonis]PWB96182.1 NAD(P)H-hydrate dehydratase [Salinibacterium hongtaonis]